jgi:hypothetical protein
MEDGQDEHGHETLINPWRRWRWWGWSWNPKNTHEEERWWLAWSWNAKTPMKKKDDADDEHDHETPIKPHEV